MQGDRRVSSATTLMRFGTFFAASIISRPAQLSIGKSKDAFEVDPTVAGRADVALLVPTKDLSVNNVDLGRDVSETNDRCGQHIQSNERPMQFLIPDE